MLMFHLTIGLWGEPISTSDRGRPTDDIAEFSLESGMSIKSAVRCPFLDLTSPSAKFGTCQVSSLDLPSKSAETHPGLQPDTEQVSTQAFHINVLHHLRPRAGTMIVVGSKIYVLSITKQTSAVSPRGSVQNICQSQTAPFLFSSSFPQWKLQWRPEATHVSRTEAIRGNSSWNSNDKNLPSTCRKLFNNSWL